MIRTFGILLISAGAMLAVTACSSSSNDSGSTGSGGSNTDGGSSGGCSQPSVSTSDGTSACSPDACSAGQHCSKTGVNCITGCTSNANCAQGQYCDMSASTKDLEQTATGVCRAPAACSTGSGSGGGGGGGSTTVVGCIGNATGGGSTDACNSVATCVESSCDAQLKTAFGDSYASNTVGGACKDYYTCVAAAGCTSDAQKSCENTINSNCENALSAVSSCEQTKCASQIQACEASVLGSLDAGGGGTVTDDASSPDASAATGQCATLNACCQGVTDANAKQDCLTEAATNDQPLCENAQSTFCPDAG